MVTALPLTLAGATAARRGKVLVGPVDLTLSRTGVTVVIGPNGAGKTSLLRMMHGLERVTAGTVAWSLPEEEARHRQAYVFQRPVALRRSVMGNLTFPLRLRGAGRTEASARAGEIAERFDLTDLLAQYAPSLSGGEMQRLALARALIVAPEILFADEPCAALDGRTTRRIESHLAEAAARGTRLVMATHDMGQARRIADDVVFLLHGRIREAGPAATFFAGPRSAEARAFLRGDILD